MESCLDLYEQVAEAITQIPESKLYDRGKPEIRPASHNIGHSNDRKSIQDVCNSHTYRHRNERKLEIRYLGKRRSCEGGNISKKIPQRAFVINEECQGKKYKKSYPGNCREAFIYTAGYKKINEESLANLSKQTGITVYIISGKENTEISV